MRNRRRLTIVLFAAAGTVVSACLSCSNNRKASSTGPTYVSSGQYTTAHKGFTDSAREFVGFQSAPQQPIAFNHQIHLKNGMQCENCHAGVNKGPDAGLPSVKLCMMCHQVIDAGNPEIEKIAAYNKKGQDIPWQRVYWFYPSAHVRFQHAPHIRTGVSCAACHGDMTQQTVAVRSVNLTMGYCLNCHKMHNASVDCTTCHF